MREPLLKVLHLMRSMEFKASRGHEEVLLRDEVSQFPYYSPTVFNFYEVCVCRGDSTSRWRG